MVSRNSSKSLLKEHPDKLREIARLVDEQMDKEVEALLGYKAIKVDGDGHIGKIKDELNP